MPTEKLSQHLLEQIVASVRLALVEDLGGGAATAFTAEGQIIDVGVGGVLARVGEGMPVGTMCTVRFTQPEAGELEAGELEAGELEARGYVRQMRSDEGVGFLVGIEFEAPLEAL